MTGTTLAARLAAAMRRMGNLKPDKFNQADRFAYRSADLILSAANEALAAEGVVIVPLVDDMAETTGQSAGGKSRYEVRIKMRFLVTDGASQIEVPWWSTGVDYTAPDRALAKAITLGHKYFVAKLLMVGVGNDEDDHEQETTFAAAPQAAPMPPRQPLAPPLSSEKPLLLRKLHALGNQAYGNAWEEKRRELCVAVSKQRTESSKELTDDELRRLIAGLEAKLQEKSIEKLQE
ncbi:MAG: hypothetical protein KatS3mg038_1572 [Candidatus Kapaibacterium sp.]|nr:MAG: hypothetical protein KatS3mg038_1572 [Candidatus Kapabacteria bacterium]